MEEADQLRHKALEEVFLRGIPRSLIDSAPEVQWGSTLHPDQSYVIHKLRYQAYPRYWVPALLYEPTTAVAEKLPVVLNPDGHHEGGKAVAYKQARCINLARRGMMALNFEFIGMGELGADYDPDNQHNNLAYLELTGISAPSLMYLAMKKAIDVLLAHRRADHTRVAMTGLSGGGWQTIVLSALDTRITVSVPVAGYTSVRARVDCVDDVGDLEQVPADLTTTLDYQEMTAMLAPRPALLILNEEDDCCFRTDRTKPVIYDAVVPTYEAFGALENLEFYNNTDPGTHNYGSDNRSRLYAFLDKHFGLDTPAGDLHREDELLSEIELNVGLPEDQLTVAEIAARRARTLGKQRPVPSTADERRDLRDRIRGTIRLPDLRVQTNRLAPTDSNAHLRLEMGPWVVPAVVSGGSGRGVELVISDDGIDAGAESRQHPDGSRTMVAANILGTGMFRSDERWLRLQMLVGTCGHRLLGIQAAQILAGAKYVATLGDEEKVHLIGHGPVSSVATLVAAALEPELFETLTVTGETASLDFLIHRGVSYGEAQPLFCLGLLEVADINQLVALLTHVQYLQPERYVPPIRSSNVSRGLLGEDPPYSLHGE